MVFGASERQVGSHSAPDLLIIEGATWFSNGWPRVLAYPLRGVPPFSVETCPERPSIPAWRSNPNPRVQIYLIHLLGLPRHPLADKGRNFLATTGLT
jgi:hypothetical protein